MTKMIRTPTKATGGITPEEKAKMDAVAQEWIGIAMRTDPIDPEKIVPAITALYAKAGLKAKRIVIAPSPLVMAFAYGAAAAIWHGSKAGAATDAATWAATWAATRAATGDATRAATGDATRDATRDVTSTATNAATWAVTRDATWAATRDATDAATWAATRAVTRDATSTATWAVTRDATSTATWAVTRDATRAATRIATDAATWAATRAVTRDATSTATNAATWAATRDATSTATRDATRDATSTVTWAATSTATNAATGAATRDATNAATNAATSTVTRDATWATTDAATGAATRAVTGDATSTATNAATGAILACFDIAGDLGVACAKRWWNAYHGGNMWAAECSYFVAARDVLGLHLPDLAPWEDAARHGGFRVMHEEFCIVSDFPEFIRVDDQRRPHCETGPSHRWRDGWSLYHWHGTRVPAAWIEDKANVSPKEVLGTADANVRAAGIQILGWDRLMSELDAKVVDRHREGMLGGELLAVAKRKIDAEARGTMKLLRAECPRNGTICFRVPDETKTAHEAQAWSRGLPPEFFKLPAIRT